MKTFHEMTLAEKVSDMRQSALQDERMSDSYQQRADEELNPKLREFYQERMEEYLHRADAWNALADDYEKRGV